MMVCPRVASLTILTRRRRRGPRLDADRLQRHRVRRQLGGTGWHLIHLQEIREQVRVLLRRETTRLIFRHLRADVAEQLGERSSLPGLVETDARVRFGGVTTPAHSGIYVPPTRRLLRVVHPRQRRPLRQRWRCGYDA